MEEIRRELGVSEAAFHRWKKQLAGMGVVLDDSRAGTREIAANPVRASLPLAGFGLEDRVFEAGGLGRRIPLDRHKDDAFTSGPR